MLKNKGQRQNYFFRTLIIFLVFCYTISTSNIALFFHFCSFSKNIVVSIEGKNKDELCICQNSYAQTLKKFQSNHFCSIREERNYGISIIPHHHHNFLTKIGSYILPYPLCCLTKITIIKNFTAILNNDKHILLKSIINSFNPTETSTSILNIKIVKPAYTIPPNKTFLIAIIRFILNSSLDQESG